MGKNSAHAQNTIDAAGIHDGHRRSQVPPWFETRGFAALLTMTQNV
jgi:hypothetical protein